MKWLLAAILAAGGLWSGLWFAGAEARRDGIEQWFEARREAGWLAEVGALKMRGFPNRLDAHLEGVALADPDGGLAVDLPFFQILALVYNSDHVITAWPDSFRLATPDTKYEIAAEGLRASMVWSSEDAAPLERANAESGPLTARRDDGRIMSLKAARLALTRQPSSSDTYRLGLTAGGIALSGAGAPAGIEAADAALDAEVRLDGPLDASTMAQIPRPIALDIRRATLRQGGLSLALAGALTIDAEGTPSGRVTLRLEDWRAAIAEAQARGWLALPRAAAIEAALGLLALGADQGEPLDVELDLSGGRVWLGPLPVAAAPRLAWR